MATDPNPVTGSVVPTMSVPGGESVHPLSQVGTGGTTTPDPTVPGVAQGSTMTAVSGVPTAADASALAQITAFLGQYGLADLGTWAWQKWTNNESIDQIMNELRSTPQYVARFPAMADLAKQGRAISEGDYINYENTVHQLVRAAGLPDGMYDSREGVANLLINNVSASEVNSRLQAAQYAAYQAPQAVKDYLAGQYGIPNVHGGLTAYYLDSAKALPLLQQQQAAAAVGGAAAQQGIGVDRSVAEELAARGVTYGQAQQGFGAVAQTRALGAGLGEQASQDQRIAAQFGDAGAQAAVGRVIRGRLAAASGGGGAATLNTGVAGLGTAQRQP